MRRRKSVFGFRHARTTVAVLGMAWIAMPVSWAAKGQARATEQETAHGTDPSLRPLSAREGRLIVNAALDFDGPALEARDCSHVVHEIYRNAGFEYPYASSFDIYAGNESFMRVKHPHVGDLVAWPGHVGIVVDPVHHSFYSLVSTGMEQQDYAGLYWRSRGRPRFYRYKIESKDGRVLSATNTAGKSRATSTGRSPR